MKTYPTKICGIPLKVVLESQSESHSVVSDSLQPHGLYRPWNSPGQNTGGGNLSLLQYIFLTQELNRGLLHCRQILYHLSYQGSPNIWASLVAQLVKNPPAMWETWVDPWVGKIPWRRERLPPPVFWPGEFHVLYSPWGCKESDMTE